MVRTKYKMGDKLEVVNWEPREGEVWGVPRDIKYATFERYISDTRITIKECDYGLSPKHFKKYKTQKWDKQENT